MPFFVHIHIEKLKNELKNAFFGHIHIGDLKNKHSLKTKAIHELRYLCVNGGSLIEKGLNFDLKLDRGR